MCKVININDYQRKNNILRTKREDVITIYELMRSNNERLNRFGRRMYNEYTKKEEEEKIHGNIKCNIRE